VLPYGWFDAPWWSEDQVLNFSTIVDALKRTYNIDENRVAVAGVSDGATGAYYIAMQDTTPYASFLPLNGFIMVLANPDTGIRAQLHPNNIRNKPWFAVNGGRDRLYPIVAVEPYLMQQGFMQRTPRGRMLTEIAYRHLDLPPPASLPAQLDLLAGFSGADVEEPA